VLGATAAAALLLAAAFESVKKDAASNGELDKFASGLRLTDEQVRKAGGSVKYLSDRTREVTGITVTWGNIASATYQVLLERAGTTSKGISDGFTSAFKWIGDFGKFTISLLLAGFAGLIELVMSVGKNLGRLATGNFDQLTNPLKDVQKQFYKTFNDVEAGSMRSASERGSPKAQLQIESDANKPPKPPKAKKQSDHGLAEALAELDAQIKGQNALAAAYQVSDAEAIKAEAMQKAEEQAIRHKGDVALFYEKELALAVAQRAADGGRLIADIHAEAAARTVVNDLVEQGVIPVQRMSQALEEQTKKRQLMAALEAAEDKGMIERAGRAARGNRQPGPSRRACSTTSSQKRRRCSRSQRTRTRLTSSSSRSSSSAHRTRSARSAWRSCRPNNTSATRASRTRRTSPTSPRATSTRRSRPTTSRPPRISTTRR
jgi:hypothetical protein